MTNTRVEDLHNWSTNKLKQYILAFVREAQSDKTHGAVRNLLDQGRFERVNQLIENAITRLGNVLPQLFVDLANEEVKHLATKLGNKAHIATLVKADVTPTITFNSTNERAATLMRSARLDFIQNLTAEQTANTRQILSNAFANGQGTRAAARQLVNAIGLTQTQLDAVDNYRTLLENNSAAALDRQLRDRRFDPTIQNAVDTDQPLTSNQIDRMVERYRQQMLNYRAENIARTEALSVLSQARQEATQQVMESAGIDPSLIQRTWNSTHDRRTRDSHVAMDQQTVGLNEPFTSGEGNELMFPGDPAAPAEDRINCRCVLTYQVLKSDEAIAA